MGDRGDDLVADQSVFEPLLEMETELVVPIERDQVGDRHQAAIARTERIVLPDIAGLMTDFVFKDPSDIRYSISAVVAVAAPVMIGMMFLAMRHYRDSIAVELPSVEPHLMH